MKIQLSESEVLALWRRRHFLDPVRSDCTVVRTDGVDYAALIGPRLRSRYLRMLRDAPPRELAPEDIAPEASLARGPHGMNGILTLPPGTVRTLSVKLSCWHAPAVPVDGGSPEALRQANPFTRGGLWEPVAVNRPGGTLELWSLHSPVELPSVERLEVILDPGPGLYVLDELGLDTLLEGL